jgi:DNA-binding MarR family transcriptional regulator
LVPTESTSSDLVPVLDRVVTSAVALTGRALAEEAPDLTVLQWRVLVVLAASEGLAMSDIARRIGSKLPATSRLIGRLRTRGLVDAGKDPSDARVTDVRLSAAGIALRHRVVERRAAHLRAIVQASGLAAADRDSLERLAAALDAAG